MDVPRGSNCLRLGLVGFCIREEGLRQLPLLTGASSIPPCFSNALPAIFSPELFGQATVETQHDFEQDS